MTTPKPRKPSLPICPESGRPWEPLGDRDECPHCGRIVRRDRDYRTPTHRYPRTLRH